jgi:phosphoglycolate phosphatase
MTPVVVLDMDGVILRTSALKVRAMLSLFTAEAAHGHAIRRYVLANTGVPRRQKIVTILRDVLDARVDADQVEQYLARYAATLEEALANAGLVEGVEAFIRNSPGPLYVSSSAPDGEVTMQLERRQLAACFAGVYGGSVPKPQALRAVRDEHPHASVVFFGDSMSDLEAARLAGTAFVGVMAEADAFGAHLACKLPSFADPRLVQRCIDEALREAGPDGVKR